MAADFRRINQGWLFVLSTHAEVERPNGHPQECPTDDHELRAVNNDLVTLKAATEFKVAAQNRRQMGRLLTDNGPCQLGIQQRFIRPYTRTNGKAERFRMTCWPQRITQAARAVGETALSTFSR
jgi:hypothetical protein